MISINQCRTLAHTTTTLHKLQHYPSDLPNKFTFTLLTPPTSHCTGVLVLEGTLSLRYAPALTFNSFCFLHLILIQKQTGFISTMNGACKVPAIPVWSSYGHSQLYSLCSPPYLSSPGTVPEKDLHSLSNEGGRSRQHSSSSPLPPAGRPQSGG